MDPRASIPIVPLHLTSIAILSPTNAPLYVHSFTSPEDELRHYHLSHAAVDVVEERIVMTSTPTKPADSYLGLLFCMEDMAFYGFQTNTKLRMVLSIALVDALIKDSDIISIFRAIHHLLLDTISNPFLALDNRNSTNGSEDIKGDWLKNSRRFQEGMKRIGELLNGGRI
ncbi:trafficking protein particle complex subunit 2, partial [Tremellales sp. Uapishka_1]